MAVWNIKAVTNAGLNIIARAQAESKIVNLTTCKISSHQYSESELPDLTDLADIQQSVSLTEKKLANNTTVKVTGNFSNENITTQFSLYTYGVYGNLDGGADTLMIVATTPTPDLVPARADGIWQALISSNITIANSEIVQVTVDLTANATMEWVNDHKLINVTYSELKGLRDNSQLVAGQQYRITDYETIINGDVTYNGTTKTLYRSTGHPFDLIVTADSENVLNENARAIQHSGDTYFANSDLSAWKLKYCIDNDTSRFNWANSSTGKGVIWGMEDEHSNIFPFDFKNIQMKRMKITANTNNILVGDYKGCYRGIDTSTELYPPLATVDENDYVWCYLFNMTTDNYTTCSDFSLNKIGDVNGWTRNNHHEVVFGELANITHQATSATQCRDNTYNKNCHCVATGGSVLFNSSIPLFFFTEGDAISNTFDDGISIIQAKSGLNYNHFGTATSGIKLGNTCQRNSFGVSCNNFILGDNCNYNSFGNRCYSNTFGTNCLYNFLGNNCANNSFGDYQQGTFLMNNCINNTFRNNTSSSGYNTLSPNCIGNIFETGVTCVNVATIKYNTTFTTANNNSVITS